VGKLLVVTAPPSRLYMAATLFVRVSAALVSCGVMLYTIGWAKATYAKSVARSLSLKENSLTMQVFLIALVLLSSTALSFAVFRVGSRRWVRVRG